MRRFSFLFSQYSTRFSASLTRNRASCITYVRLSTFCCAASTSPCALSHIWITFHAGFGGFPVSARSIASTRLVKSRAAIKYALCASATMSIACSARRSAFAAFVFAASRRPFSGDNGTRAEATGPTCFDDDPAASLCGKCDHYVSLQRRSLHHLLLLRLRHANALVSTHDHVRLPLRFTLCIQALRGQE